MPLTVKGANSLTLESFGTLMTDRYGMSSATAKWFSASPITSVPIAFGASHPHWTFLKCDKVIVTHASPYWGVEANYFGVDGTTAAIYELDSSLSEEPIQTHPQFATFAGTKVLPLNGAVFDEDGLFTAFAGANPTWVGVTSYVAPGMVWRKTYCSNSIPSSSSGMGKLSAPEGGPPGVDSGRTWLFWSLTFQQKGLTYMIRKEWRLSGPRGWNTTIYG